MAVLSECQDTLLKAHYKPGWLNQLRHQIDEKAKNLLICRAPYNYKADMLQLVTTKILVKH